MREIVLGIIPARRNSVRVPNKNLKLLSGIPLIQYAVNAAKGASLIDKIIITTDHRLALSVRSGWQFRNGS